MGIGVLAGLLAAVLYGVPAALQAIAARRLPEGSWFAILLAGVRDPLMVSVVVMYLLGFVCQLVAIAGLPLYLVQALVASSLLFTALASARILEEWPNRRQWLALAAVCWGLVVLAFVAGEPGHHHFGDDFVIGLFLWLLAVLAATALAAHWNGRRAGAALGLLAGTAYAGVPVAARALLHPVFDPVDALTLIALAGFGIAAFTVFSLGLQRTSVAAATAPMVIAETVLPSAIGLGLLGDGIDRGGWMYVVIGLALCVGGCVGVADTEPPLPPTEQVPAGDVPAS